MNSGCILYVGTISDPKKKANCSLTMGKDDIIGIIDINITLTTISTGENKTNTNFKSSIISSPYNIIQLYLFPTIGWTI